MRVAARDAGPHDAPRTRMIVTQYPAASSAADEVCSRRAAAFFVKPLRVWRWGRFRGLGMQISGRLFNGLRQGQISG